MPLLYVNNDRRSLSVRRALTPFVSISELDDADKIVSSTNYSYRSSSVPPLTDYALSTYSPYYGGLSYYRRPIISSYSSYDDILPYRSYFPATYRFSIRLPPREYTPPTIINRNYHHYRTPHYHYYTPPPPAPIIRNDTYSPVYHYHYDYPKTRTTTTTTRRYYTSPDYSTWTYSYPSTYYNYRMLY